jgi:hypothetical protein
MAIQVGGTTVIDNSRVLSNVTGLKTINSTSILGSGNISAGASTTFGAVGTYTWGRPANNSNYPANTTASGLRSTSNTLSALAYRSPSAWVNTDYTVTMSGTWRSMNGSTNQSTSGTSYGATGMWVRIS